MTENLCYIDDATYTVGRKHRLELSGHSMNSALFLLLKQF